MQSGDILSFMDFLDLDEELIDIRANNLMDKSSFSKEHLLNFRNLVMYKQLINSREDSECCNTNEYNFIGKLINNVNEDNVDIVCKVIKAVLILNPSTVVDKSEHLIQQILFEIKLPEPKIKTVDGCEELGVTLLQLKVCGSILDAVLDCDYKLSLPYLETPLEYIICSQNESLKVYFLTNTVIRFFEGIAGYNILDRLWNFLRRVENGDKIALKVLCCLSNYYLPIKNDSKNVALESDVIFHGEFWDFVLNGLSNIEDTSVRKHAVYLAKRAIDCAYYNDKYINITSKSIFMWNYKNKVNLKKMWDNYFILIDTLDEKQSNIVLPSLKLFDVVKDIGDCWLNCAFNFGLHHDNAQVRYQCLHYRLKYPIKNENEAFHLLEAINDINLYEHDYNYALFNNKLKENFTDTNTLMNVLKVMPDIKWSPVPLYHLTTVLAGVRNENFAKEVDDQLLLDLICKIVKIPCNNTVMRTAVHTNMSCFVGNCCKGLHWKDYVYLYSNLQLDSWTSCGNSFKQLLVDSKTLLLHISLLPVNIDLAISYLESHNDKAILEIIDGMVTKICDISNRQYSFKLQCLEDAIFVVQLYKKTMNKKGQFFDSINAKAEIVLRTILEYVKSLLTSNVTIEKHIPSLFDGLDSLTNQIKHNYEETVVQLYKSAILLLKDESTNLDKKTLAILVLNSCVKTEAMTEYYKYEIDFEAILDTVNVKFNKSIENSGRVRNAFFEKSCEIVSSLVHSASCKIDTILKYIDCVLECGGYGCLKWIIMIMKVILSKILDDTGLKFDVTQFLKRMWSEIEELKSNSQYSVCSEEFIKLILQDALLKRPEYNNIIMLYCNKIIDHGSVKNSPLYYLVKQMNEIDLSQYSHMILVLNDVLLYSNVPRKDHRVIEKVTLEILEQPKYGIDKMSVIFNSDIKTYAICALTKIKAPEILNTLTAFMTKKVDDIFRNKQRYHANSQHERALQACLQNLLFIFLKCREVNMDKSLEWVLAFLGRIPHQPYVRICFEWYIALYFYYKNTIINEEILNQMTENNVPLQSQFMMLYWLVTRKLKTHKCQQSEYDYVMKLLLSHIMGPIYNIRLYAQFLSARVFEANLQENVLDGQQYSYTINIIRNTLGLASKAKDKSFDRLSKDYFVQIFDIVEDLTPYGIYYCLPKLSECYAEVIKKDFIEHSINVINEAIHEGTKDAFLNEWIHRHINSGHFIHSLGNGSENVKCSNFDDNLETGTLQKKYVPWKNMSDIDVYDVEKKKDKSNLIVVASLIDKLPNLGGMARTSEVFGVNTYVMDSLRHIQDKKFQGLSVSAERWVDVEEVRPSNLKDYLVMKKAEGFTIVAAEQTSNSKPLQNYKFPLKTLLLLGHEKEGVPCDLLPLMDECVEIPQRGVIRSLNVHVTAAIFIWEYARQNML